MSGVFVWMARQILGTRSSGEAVRDSAYNPNPSGTIYFGSTSDVVLAVLNRYSPRWLTYSQIVDFTGCTPKAVSWSLCHLKAKGHIEGRPSGDPRSQLYQMYRACGRDES